VAEPIKEGLDFIRSEFLALAFMGSLFALSFWPQSTRKKAAFRVIVGAAISCTSTPIAIYALKSYAPTIPDDGLYWAALACFFWAGFLSSHIARAAADAVRRLPRVKFPGA